MKQQRQHLVSVEKIVDLMRARMRDLVLQWQLKGQYESGDFVALNPLRPDRSLGSFRVCVEGQFQGLVRDFAWDKSWSPLSFTADLWFGGDNVKAIKWAKAWLGIDGTDPEALQKTRRAIDAAGESAHDAEAAAAAAKKRQRAQAIYFSASADLIDSPVDAYLAGRGIDLRRLDFLPGAIRFVPELWNNESQRRWPAMVASIINPGGDIVAVHRTWLQIHGDGMVTKAPLAQAKKVLGAFRSGFISLWKGVYVHRETGEIRKCPPLSKVKGKVWVDVTEGIEDGLSVAISDPSLRVIAGVSVSNLVNLALPEAVEGVVLWRQDDKERAAVEAFQRAVLAFQRRGKQVKIADPAAGFKDVNELLQGIDAGSGGQDETRGIA